MPVITSEHGEKMKILMVKKQKEKKEELILQISMIRTIYCMFHSKTSMKLYNAIFQAKLPYVFCSQKG